LGLWTKKRKGGQGGEEVTPHAEGRRAIQLLKRNIEQQKKGRNTAWGEKNENRWSGHCGKREIPLLGSVEKEPTHEKEKRWRNVREKGRSAIASIPIALGSAKKKRRRRLGQGKEGGENSREGGSRCR